MSELAILRTVFFSLLVILTLLLTYLLIRKRRERIEREQIELYKERTRGIMLKYLYEGVDSRLLFPDHRVKTKALEELLHDFSHVVESVYTKKRIEQFAERFFEDEYRKQLFHRRWSIRMNILYLIEEFHMRSLLPDVLRLYEKSYVTQAEESQILKMLAIFEHPDLLTYIKQTKFELSELTYRVIYGSMSKDTFTEFVQVFDSLPERLQLTLIDMIGITNRVEYGPFLEHLLMSEKREIRIRTLKAIAQIHYPLSTDKLIAHLQADNWPEKIMAVKICGLLQVEESIPYLRELMQDRVFQVRSQSAQAIVKFTHGKAILQNIIETTSDTFARDMALEWLERESVQ